MHIRFVLKHIPDGLNLTAVSFSTLVVIVVLVFVLNHHLDLSNGVHDSCGSSWTTTSMSTLCSSSSSTTGGARLVTCDTLCATRIDEGREGIGWMDCDEIGCEAGGTHWG